MRKFCGRSFLALCPLVLLAGVLSHQASAHDGYVIEQVTTVAIAAVEHAVWQIDDLAAAGVDFGKLYEMSPRGV